MRLLCKECLDGLLSWVDPEYDMDGDMKCEQCGYVYHGMGGFLAHKSNKIYEGTFIGYLIEELKTYEEERDEEDTM